MTAAMTGSPMKQIAPIIHSRHVVHVSGHRASSFVRDDTHLLFRRVVRFFGKILCRRHPGKLFERFAEMIKTAEAAVERNVGDRAVIFTA